MLPFRRDAVIVALALGAAAALYVASFHDLVTTDTAYDGFGFSTLSLQLHVAEPGPLDVG